MKSLRLYVFFVLLFASCSFQKKIEKEDINPSLIPY